VIANNAKAVRKAIVAQLQAREVGGPSAVIVSTRGRDIPDEEIPVNSAFINVFSKGSSGSPVGGGQAHLPRFDHSEDFVIACSVRLPEGQTRAGVDEALGDAIDDLETAILEALLCNRDFNALEFGAYKAEKGMSVRAGSYRGDFAILLPIRWRRQFVPGPEPGSPDDELRTIVVDYDADRDGAHEDHETSIKITGLYFDLMTGPGGAPMVGPDFAPMGTGGPPG